MIFILFFVFRKKRDEAICSSSIWIILFVSPHVWVCVCFCFTGLEAISVIFFLSQISGRPCDCATASESILSHLHIFPVFIGWPAKARKCHWGTEPLFRDSLQLKWHISLFGWALSLKSECVNLWLCWDQWSKRMCCNKRSYEGVFWLIMVYLSQDLQFESLGYSLSPDPPLPSP